MGKKQKLRCQHDDTYFDRTVCAEPCGVMHTSCKNCGYIFGGCYWLNRGEEPDELTPAKTDTFKSVGGSWSDFEYERHELKKTLTEMKADTRAVTTHDGISDQIEATLTNILTLNNTKGREYATEEDGLANFKNRAEQMGITPGQVWGIFYGKHSDAIYSYLKRGDVLSEPIEGRIDDAILYLILLKSLIAEGAA